MDFSGTKKQWHTGKGLITSVLEEKLHAYQFIINFTDKERVVHNLQKICTSLYCNFHIAHCHRILLLSFIKLLHPEPTSDCTVCVVLM